jgi:hypothetical protein
MPSNAPRVVLELYVKDGSPSCTRAAANLARLLARYDETGFSYTVRNLSQMPLAPSDKSVPLVPMLVIRGGRRQHLVSDLDDTTEVEDALATARVARKS